MCKRLKMFFIKRDLEKYIDKNIDVCPSANCIAGKIVIDESELKDSAAKNDNPLKTVGVSKKIDGISKTDGLNSVVGEKTKPFSKVLLDLIDQKGLSDVECYKRANIDRKLFSKIRSNAEYKPSKNTVFAFAVALKLNTDECRSLLESAGFSLSHSFVTDIIVEYFLLHNNFDIDLINIALYDYKQAPLTNF